MRELLMCLFWIVIGVLIGMETYEGSVMRDCEQMHMLQADQLEALRQQLKEAGEEITLLLAEMSAMRVDNASLRDEIAELETWKRAATAIGHDLQTTIASLRQQLEAAKGQGEPV